MRLCNLDADSSIKIRRIDGGVPPRRRPAPFYEIRPIADSAARLECWEASGWRSKSLLSFLCSYLSLGGVHIAMGNCIGWSWCRFGGAKSLNNAGLSADTDDPHASIISHPFDWTSALLSQNKVQMADSNYFSLVESLSEEPLEENCQVLSQCNEPTSDDERMDSQRKNTGNKNGRCSRFLARFKNVRNGHRKQRDSHSPDSAVNSGSDLEWEPEQMMLSCLRADYLFEYSKLYGYDNSAGTLPTSDDQLALGVDHPTLEWDTEDVMDSDTLELLFNIDSMAQSINSSL
uniref:SERTA domain-containing protein n=1 Tax=Trichuris muris TaxID=70415 RepID=A0A5S6Q0F5_TRIMR